MLSFCIAGDCSASFCISGLYNREKPEVAMAGEGGLYMGCILAAVFCGGRFVGGDRAVICPARVVGCIL